MHIHVCIILLYQCTNNHEKCIHFIGRICKDAESSTCSGLSFSFLQPLVHLYNMLSETEGSLRLLSLDNDIQTRKWAHGRWTPWSVFVWLLLECSRLFFKKPLHIMLRSKASFLYSQLQLCYKWMWEWASFFFKRIFLSAGEDQN